MRFVNVLNLLILLVSAGLCGCHRASDDEVNTDSSITTDKTVNGRAAGQPYQLIEGKSMEEIVGSISAKNKFINTKAKNFELASLKGQEFRLSSFKGEVVVLNFWFKGCPNCILETPALNRIYNDSKKEGFVFISVCTTSKQDLAGYVLKSGDQFKYAKKFRDIELISYDILPDGGGVADAFGMNSYPTTIVIDKDGIIRATMAYMVNDGDQDFFYNLLKTEIKKYL